jgi:restriction endonuclease S subunit
MARGYLMEKYKSLTRFHFIIPQRIGFLNSKAKKKFLFFYLLLNSFLKQQAKTSHLEGGCDAKGILGWDVEQKP